MWIEISIGFGRNWINNVTSLAEVWIEICTFEASCPLPAVTSLAEVWIEIEVDEMSKGRGVCHFPGGRVV